jgi:hypothetical protein
LLLLDNGSRLGQTRGIRARRHPINSKVKTLSTKFFDGLIRISFINGNGDGRVFPEEVLLHV